MMAMMMRKNDVDVEEFARICEAILAVLCDKKFPGNNAVGTCQMVIM
jgi:hypothetical protein